MIVKMKFLSISGPRTDIDRVCDVYPVSYTHLDVYKRQIYGMAESNGGRRRGWTRIQPEMEYGLDA